MALGTESSSKAGHGEAEEVGLEKREGAGGSGRRQLGCRVAVGVALSAQSFVLARPLELEANAAGSSGQSWVWDVFEGGGWAR